MDPTQRHLYNAYGFPSSQMQNEGKSKVDEEFERKYSEFASKRIVKIIVEVIVIDKC